MTVDGPTPGSPLVRMLVAPRGVYLLSEGKEVADPPVLLLKLPAKAGEAWEAAGRAGKAKMTTVGVEKVEVLAGTYDAVRVDAVVSKGGEASKASSWYAPGVGMVKATAGGETVMELKTFTKGKD